jgi:hypothetical protein
MEDPAEGRHRSPDEPGQQSQPGRELATRPAGPALVPDDSWTRENPQWTPTPRRTSRLIIVAVTVGVLLLALSALVLRDQTSAPPPAALDPTAPPFSTGSPAPGPSTTAELMPVQTAPPRTDSASSTPTEPAGPSQSSTVSPVWTSLTVQPTRVWNLGDAVQTNRTKVLLQADGDLVVIDELGAVRWRAGTAGRGHHAVFQNDGHFVVYDAGQRPLWSSGTAGHSGAVLVLSTDGNVSILQNGVVLWYTNTAH